MNQLQNCKYKNVKLQIKKDFKALKIQYWAKMKNFSFGDYFLLPQKSMYRTFSLLPTFPRKLEKAKKWLFSAISKGKVGLFGIKILRKLRRILWLQLNHEIRLEIKFQNLLFTTEKPGVCIEFWQDVLWRHRSTFRFHNKQSE